VATSPNIDNIDANVVSDVADPGFITEAHRQSAAIAASDYEADYQAVVDAISWEWDTDHRGLAG